MEKNEIAALAELCKLEFENEALTAFADEFGAILSFVDQLSELDTEGTEAYVSPLHAPLRADEPSQGLLHERVMQNAPQTDGDGFLIPRVL